MIISALHSMYHLTNRSLPTYCDGREVNVWYWHPCCSESAHSWVILPVCIGLWPWNNCNDHVLKFGFANIQTTHLSWPDDANSGSSKCQSKPEDSWGLEPPPTLKYVLNSMQRACFSVFNCGLLYGILQGREPLSIGIIIGQDLTYLQGFSGGGRFWWWCHLVHRFPPSHGLRRVSKAK